VLAIVVGKLTSDHQFAYYAQVYPRDGQDGLGAFMDGLYAGAITEVIGFVLLFLLQIIYVHGSKSED